MTRTKPDEALIELLTQQRRISLAELNADKEVSCSQAYYDIISLLGSLEDYIDINEDKIEKIASHLAEELKEKDVALIDFYESRVFGLESSKVIVATGDWNETRPGHFPFEHPERWKPVEGKKLIVVWYRIPESLRESPEMDRGELSFYRKNHLFFLGEECNPAASQDGTL